MEKKALLVVSFGTCAPEALERDLVPVEETVSAALPEYVPFRAFESGVIIQKRKAGNRLAISSVPEALTRLREQGFAEVLVQPAFLLHGREHSRLLGELEGAKGWFSSLRVGEPLLSAPADDLELAAGLAESFPAEKGPVLLMGHGTGQDGNQGYSGLAAALAPHMLLGVMEGSPGLDALIPRLRERGIGQLTLVPLMLAAGSHAETDMASNAPHSWKTRLAAAGIRADCVLRGLGSRSFVQKMFARHAVEAASK